MFSKQFLKVFTVWLLYVDDFFHNGDESENKCCDFVCQNDCGEYPVKFMSHVEYYRLVYGRDDRI